MLSPEEIKRRRKEYEELSEKRRLLIEKLCAAHISLDNKTYDSLLDEFNNLNPNQCEHGHSWMDTCMACDDIHKECFPEHYDKCSICGEPCDHDELDKDGICFDCPKAD